MKYMLRLEVYQIFFFVLFAFIISWVEPYGIVELIFTFFSLFWFYSVATAGYRKYNFKNKGLYVFFNINLLFMAIWAIAQPIFYPDVAPNRLIHSIHPDVFFMILSTYSMVALLFIIYLTSRILGSNEEKKLAGFGKSIWYFIGFFFLFIGIWFIQPKASAMVDQEKDNHN